MPRQIERDLYQALVGSQFSFMERGIKSIGETYRAVKSRYQELCDDSYYYFENCSYGDNQPEWRHTVRNAMQNVRSIVHTGRRGHWEFR